MIKETENQFWKKHYGQLVGLTILKVEFEEDEFGDGDPWPILLVGKETKSGVVDVRTARWVTIQCDAEGNAAGFAAIEPIQVDNAKATTAAYAQGNQPMATHYARHRFYFEYDLERGDECLPIEVAYYLEDGEVYLDSVKFDGAPLPTTAEEDRELITHAYEHLREDVASAEADYGDYLYDMRREQED